MFYRINYTHHDIDIKSKRSKNNCHNLIPESLLGICENMPELKFLHHVEDKREEGFFVSGQNDFTLLFTDGHGTLQIE